MKWIQQTRQRTAGFTIVELLIVIVVIAILAAIVMVAYNGVTERAREGIVKSDLSSTAKKIALYKIENGSYPSSLDVNTRVQSEGTTLTYTTSGLKYCVQASSTKAKGTVFFVTDEGAVREGSCMATAVAITSGANFSCLQGSNSKAYCWGYGAGGRLGTGSVASASVPTVVVQGAIPNEVTIASLEAGTAQGCIVGSDKKAYCWGYNGDGRLGIGATGDKSSPTAMSQGAMPGGVTVHSLWSANATGCLLGSDHKLYCWGRNNFGQLGNGITTESYVPVAVVQGGIPSGVTIVAATDSADDHVCALGSNEKVYCWGGNTYGQLGNGTTTARSTPGEISQGQIPDGVTIKTIKAGTFQTCAIGSDRWVYCWGANYSGQLGDGSMTNQSAPVAVSRGAIPANVTITSLATRAGRTCAIASNDKVYCWGANFSGQLGNGQYTNSLSPVAVSQGAIPSGVRPVDIVTGDTHTCILGSDGQVYCWGSNYYSQLGNGTTEESTTPAVVTLPLI